VIVNSFWPVPAVAVIAGPVFTTEERTAMKKSTTTKERPIPLSAYWVRALRDGRKTVTRRVWNPKRRLTGDEPSCPYGPVGDLLWVRETWRSHPLYPDQLLYRADFPADDKSGPWKPSRFMPRVASRIDLRITGVYIQSLQSITEEDVVAEGVRAINGEGTGPRSPRWHRWDGIGYESPVNPGSYHVPDGRGLCTCNRLMPGRNRSQCAPDYELVLPPALCAWRQGWDALNAERGCSWEDSPDVWVVSFEVESIRSQQ
jgi:hypothetical protein